MDDKEPNEPADSDEEDEDYVPGADPNEQGAASDDDGDNNAVGAAEDDGPITLSITKQKAVDDAFYDLFGYTYTLSSTTHNSSSSTKSTDKIPIKSKHTSILSSIFGKYNTIKLMKHAKITASKARPKPRSGGMLRLEKRVITEVKRFAGQEIKIEKVVLVPVMLGDENDTTDKLMLDGGAGRSHANITSSQKDSAAASATGKVKGVDNLLTELAKPEKLSTVAKTSADWDLFKSKNADDSLKEQLESSAVGNDAYLVKKDFLNRVDTRRFEAEKTEREMERAKRGK